MTLDTPGHLGHGKPRDNGEVTSPMSKVARVVATLTRGQVEVRLQQPGSSSKRSRANYPGHLGHGGRRRGEWRRSS